MYYSASVLDKDQYLTGYMRWVEEPRLYIDYLWAEEPKTTVILFARFRRLYPNSIVYFHAASDNDKMMRFVELIGATETPHGYAANTGKAKEKYNES